MTVSTNLAMADNKQVLPQSVDVRVDKSQDAMLQLEVKQMPLGNVLKTLSAKTGIPIHYSVLPEGVITATCVGKALKPVLECLLDHKADVIVRYKLQANNGTMNRNDIAEAWVLGAKLEAVPANGFCNVDGGQGEIKLIDNSKQHKPTGTALTKLTQTDRMLKIVEEGNAEERAQAIGDLLMIGREDDPKVKAMLEQAVHDQDENVRAQAVSTLTHREDYSEHATEIIREALQDQSVDVRLMAVDGITDNEELLQQAQNDPDESVREYANSKLEELLNRGK